MSSNIAINFKKTYDDVEAPILGSNGAAGYDLYAHITTDVTVPAGERRLIATGISLAIPHGYYGRIAPRSGLALNHGIDVLAGVIDSDYRGEIGVILLNTGRTSYKVRPHERIAQIIFERCYNVDWRELAGTDFGVDSSGRGSGGFGSTGSH